MLIWVIDSSSVIEVKQIPLKLRPGVVDHLDRMVAEGRLAYPPQVLAELRRYAPPRSLKTDLPYTWAKKNEPQASYREPLFLDAKAILKEHPDLIDADKGGEDPADPYVIALARKLRGGGYDARIVTDDTRNINRKVSVAAVAGLLGIPSTVMRLFLRGEGYPY